MQTLSRCPYSPRVQSHTSASVRTLKIPNTGSHTIVGHTEILRTLIGMGSAALAAAVWLTQARRPTFPTRDCAYPGKATHISHKGLCLPRQGDPNFPQGTVLTQARRPKFPTRDCEVLKKEKRFVIPTCLRPEAIQQQTKEETSKCPPAVVNWELHADLLPGSLSDWETGEQFCPESSPRQLLFSRLDLTEFLRPPCPTAETW